MAKVVLKDDRLRVNSHTVVTKEDVARAIKKGKKPFPVGTVLLAKDKKGRQIMDVVETKIVLEGAHLEHAIRRARRWMANRPLEARADAPRHIRLGMAAFSLVDPESFKAELAA